MVQPVGGGPESLYAPQASFGNVADAGAWEAALSQAAPPTPAGAAGFAGGAFGQTDAPTQADYAPAVDRPTAVAPLPIDPSLAAGGAAMPAHSTGFSGGTTAPVPPLGYVIARGRAGGSLALGPPAAGGGLRHSDGHMGLVPPLGVLGVGDATPKLAGGAGAGTSGLKGAVASAQLSPVAGAPAAPGGPIEQADVAGHTAKPAAGTVLIAQNEWADAVGGAVVGAESATLGTGPSSATADAGPAAGGLVSVTAGALTGAAAPPVSNSAPSLAPIFDPSTSKPSGVSPAPASSRIGLRAPVTSGGGGTQAATTSAPGMAAGSATVAGLAGHAAGKTPATGLGQAPLTAPAMPAAVQAGIAPLMAAGPAQALNAAPNVVANAAPAGATGAVAGPAMAPNPTALAASIAAMHQAGTQMATLRLDPPGLGTLAVHLGLEAGAVNVTFVPSVSHTGALLTAGLDGLRQAMAQNGLILGQAQVDGTTASAPTGSNPGGNPFGAAAGQTGGQFGGQLGGQLGGQSGGHSGGQPAPATIVPLAARGVAAASEPLALRAGTLSAYA